VQSPIRKSEAHYLGSIDADDGERVACLFESSGGYCSLHRVALLPVSTRAIRRENDRHAIAIASVSGEGQSQAENLIILVRGEYENAAPAVTGWRKVASPDECSGITYSTRAFDQANDRVGYGRALQRFPQLCLNGEHRQRGALQPASD
jgi:hypothetical protein